MSRYYKKVLNIFKLWIVIQLFFNPVSASKSVQDDLKSLPFSRAKVNIPNKHSKEDAFSTQIILSRIEATWENFKEDIESSIAWLEAPGILSFRPRFALEWEASIKFSVRLNNFKINDDLF